MKLFVLKSADYYSCYVVARKTWWAEFATTVPQDIISIRTVFNALVICVEPPRIFAIRYYN